MNNKSRSDQSYFVRSGLKEIELLRKHFHIIGKGEDIVIDREITPTNVRDFFTEYFASVRPPNLGNDKILPDPDPKQLRAWYVGQPDANVLLNLVVRHSLYVDQILLVDPFLTLPHEDIQSRPSVWAQTLINRALCLCALQEWVESEIVLLIPNVFHYHPSLREIAASMPLSITDDQLENFGHWTVIRLLVSESPDTRTSMLDVLEPMGQSLKKSEREGLLAEAERYETENPIRFRLPADFYDKYLGEGATVSRIFDSTLSVPLLLAPVVAEQTGSFLILEHKIFHEVLSSNLESLSPRSDSLQQLALAFQQLDFPFLHNVPLHKALDLRKRGFLRSFRIYLRDLWSVIASANSDSQTLDERIFDFSDRLNSEYAILEQDWRHIRKELRLKAVTSGMVVGISAFSAVAIGNISWTVAAAAGAGAGLLKEQVAGYIGSSEKLQETQKHPLSVFLTLAHERDRFKQ